MNTLTNIHAHIHTSIHVSYFDLKAKKNYEKGELHITVLLYTQLNEETTGFNEYIKIRN